MKMKMKINLLVFPYRGINFYYEYGLAVRDLQMLAALIDSPLVESVTIVERPLTVYDIVLNKIKGCFSKDLGVFESSKVKIIQKTSFDIFFPLLKGRLWTLNSYNQVYNLHNLLDEIYDQKLINVVLDFTPIADLKINEKWYHWYDLIDNFKKHNRFSESQKKAVAMKYDYLNGSADLITGVSKGAVSQFNKALVVPNAVGVKKEIKNYYDGLKNYDFGFIGFVTNKLDINFLEILARNNFSIVIYGDIYDQQVKKSLEKIKNITLKGAFHSSEIPNLLKTFKVGLIPYLKERMHDESPLKLYQYLQAGLPVLTSTYYDLYDRYIIEYDNLNEKNLVELLIKLLDESTQNDVISHIQSLISDQFYWDYKINNILNKIVEDKTILNL